MVIKLNFVQTMSTRFGQEFEVEVQAKLLKLKFGQYFAAETWFEFWNLIKICVRTYFFDKQNSTLESAVPLAMFDFLTLHIQVDKSLSNL